MKTERLYILLAERLAALQAIEEATSLLVYFLDECHERGEIATPANVSEALDALRELLVEYHDADAVRVRDPRNPVELDS